MANKTIEFYYLERNKSRCLTAELVITTGKRLLVTLCLGRGLERVLFGFSRVCGSVFERKSTNSTRSKRKRSIIIQLYEWGVTNNGKSVSALRSTQRDGKRRRKDGEFLGFTGHNIL